MTLKLLIQRIKDGLKFFRRTIRIALKSPALAKDYLNFRSATKAHDWSTAKSMMSGIAKDAYKVEESRLLKEMSHAAMRFLDLDLHIQWDSKCEILNGNTKQTDWSGEDLSDATLWVSFKDTEKQGISTGMNLSGYVRAAQKYAKYTVLVVDKRLVHIFSRTLPKVEVLPAPVRPTAKQNTRLVTANPLTLRLAIGVKPSDLNRLYTPLIPDQTSVNSFRLKYDVNNSRELLFGIAWGSFSVIKSEAPLEFWIDLVQSINAIFVVTQYKYDGFDNDLDRIINSAPGRIIVDSTVDQLVDMDSFAAQLSSLDALISTSSSDTNFAGALGIPTFMVCDDLFRRACPVESYNKIPWYPDSTLYGKSGREWSVVFRDLKNGLMKRYGQSILIN